MIKVNYNKNDNINVDITKNTYNKIKDILYFEEEDKQQIIDNIQNIICCRLATKSDIKDIDILEVEDGYKIVIKYKDYNRFIYCYTLSEVIIHLRYI